MSWAKRFNPLAPRPRRGSSHADQIKAWVAEFLPTDAAAVVAVSELACREPGCPDMETVIGVFRLKRPTQMLKIAKPLVAVERADIEQAVAAAAGLEHLTKPMG
ncbi:MAG TPA: nitrate reductase [Mesorhizobium sp.]|nr:nitrate reductase [Mesorhizobium sp.]